MPKSNAHDRLLGLVRARTEKQTEFNYGILTADRYVRRYMDEIGVQACYRHMCRTKGDWASFDDALQKASGTLSYCNPDMEVKAKGEDELPSGIERPKNTLMVFRHVLTTSKKDRDGDILRTKGAKPDPRMLLLWQHVHTLPIGKMLGVAGHTKDELQLYSCIVDMNELCHDAAVMVDNGMGRFSHGFRALDFLEIKDKEGRDSAGGFDVKEFEILEESLVSVPANPDAETEEVLLSLVEGGKLTSPLMKDFGRAVRERRPVSVDVKVYVNNQEIKSDADKSRNEAGRGAGAGIGSPEEAEADGDEGRGEEKSAEAKEVKIASRPTYSGDLIGSWERIECELRNKARRYLLAMGISLGEQDWINVVGTFSDYAVLCIERQGLFEYYKVEWTMVDGVASFQGEPKRVEIETTTEIVEKMRLLREQAVCQPEGQKPYPNEHALRLNDPDKYKRIRRQNDKFGPGIHAIFGVTEDGKTELQAIRFSADKFTVEEAREWLEEHDYKTGGFEPAKESEKQLIDDSVSGGVHAAPPKPDYEGGGKQMVCPECSYVGPGKGGKCPECGAKLMPRKDFVLEKLGRVLSKANEGKIRDAIDDLDEASKTEGIPRGCKALVVQARRSLEDVVSSLGGGEGVEKTEMKMDAKQAMAVLLASGGEEELKVMASMLKAIEDGRQADVMARQYSELFS